jgi:hypothetical protein
MMSGTLARVVAVEKLMTKWTSLRGEEMILSFDLGTRFDLCNGFWRE